MYKRLLPSENDRIIQRYIDIKEGVTIDKGPKPERLKLIIYLKKDKEKF